VHCKELWMAGQKTSSTLLEIAWPNGARACAPKSIHPAQRSTPPPPIPKPGIHKHQAKHKLFHLMVPLVPLPTQRQQSTVAIAVTRTSHHGRAVQGPSIRLVEQLPGQRPLTLHACQQQANNQARHPKPITGARSDRSFPIHQAARECVAQTNTQATTNSTTT